MQEVLDSLWIPLCWILVIAFAITSFWNAQSFILNQLLKPVKTWFKDQLFQQTLRDSYALSLTIFLNIARIFNLYLVILFPKHAFLWILKLFLLEKCR